MAAREPSAGRADGGRAPLSHGSIWWANLPMPAGRRPVLLLTRDAVIGRMANVTVAPLTRTDRGRSTEVRLAPSPDGVPTTCVVTLDNILTIPLAVLHRPITQLGRARMDEVYAAIRIALQMQ